MPQHRTHPTGAAKWSLTVVRVDDTYVARLALRNPGDIIAFVDLSPSATVRLSKALLEYTLAAANRSRTQGTTIATPSTKRTMADALLALDGPTDS